MSCAPRAELVTDAGWLTRRGRWRSSVGGHHLGVTEPLLELAGRLALVCGVEVLHVQPGGRCRCRLASRPRPGAGRHRAGRGCTPGGSGARGTSDPAATSHPSRRGTHQSRSSPRLPKSPGDRRDDTDDRVRTDRGESGSVTTLRVNGRLHHIGVGRTHARTHVLLLVCDLHIRVVNASPRAPPRADPRPVT